MVNFHRGEMGAKLSSLAQVQSEGEKSRPKRKSKSRTWSLRRSKVDKASAEKETNTSDVVVFATPSKRETFEAPTNEHSNCDSEKRAVFIPEIPVKRNEMTMSSLNQSYDLVFDEKAKAKKPESLSTPTRGPKSNETISRELHEAEERRKAFLQSIRDKAQQDSNKVQMVLKTKEESKSKISEDRKVNLENKIKHSQILREKVLGEITGRARSFNEAVENFSPKSASKSTALNASFESAQLARQELLNKRQEKLSKHWEHVVKVKNSVKQRQECDGKENE